MLCRAIQLVHSSHTSFGIGPMLPQCCRIYLAGRIKRRYTSAIEFHLLGPVPFRYVLVDTITHSRGYLVGIIFDEQISKSHTDALFSTMNGPDERSIGRVKLIDTGLLLDHLGTVQSKPGFARHDCVAGYASDKRHSAETADSACNDCDHRGMLTKSESRRDNLGNSCQTKVRFLKAHTARLQQEDCSCRFSGLGILRGEIQCGGHLGAGYF